MNKAFKYRIYPSKEQTMKLNSFFGCNRFVYNYFLEKKISLYEKDRSSLSYTKMANMLALMKKEEQYSFLNDVDSVSLQQSLRHLDMAFSNFFHRKEVGFPKYKSKKSHHYSYSSVMINSNIKIFESKIQLPKIGLVKMVKHRSIPSNYIIKSITVSKDPDDKYYVSVLLEYDNQVAQVEPHSFIGLDYSIHNLFVDSEGNISNYPRYLSQSEDKLVRESRRLSLMKKGSNNFNKQRLKVARLHSHISNQRKDYLHKESRRIANSFDCVIIEDLTIQEMSRDEKIKNLHLAKAISDNGWNLFTNMLEYKLKEQGKMLIKIDKYFPSSQKCSCCGNINKVVKDFSIRKWICPSCGHTHNRDINAAINIREEGRRLFLSQYNRGTHGVSSPMLGSLGSSNEKPPLL